MDAAKAHVTDTNGSSLGQSWPGLVVWVALLLAALFIATKHLWFDAMQTGEKASFWVSLSVAAGTLLLAAVTWWNVRQTSRVIAAEDRRLMQSLAPLLLLQLHISGFEYGPQEFFGGFTVKNHGEGLAREISIAVRYFQTYSSESPKTHELTDSVDALAEREEKKIYLGQYSEDETWDLDGVTFDEMRVTYLDMFGNSYSTIYSGLHSYRWQPPSHLTIVMQPVE